MISLCRDCFILEKGAIFRCVNCNSHRIASHDELETLNIAHIDCDAFYAAIHKRDDKSLKNKPVIIGGETRGVVATACYIARSYGVKSAMPIFQAKKLCPDGVYIKPQMSLYAAEGKKIKAIMEELTPMVEQVSIDEAYLDLGGTQRLHGMNPAQSLVKLAKKIETEIGITVSIGLSNNKFLAKIASDMDKPRGFFILAPQDVPNILWPKDILTLHGVGPSMVKKLNKLGLKTIGDLAQANFKLLYKEIGDYGSRLIELANGIDNRKFESQSVRKSISTETTFFKDKDNFDELSEMVFEMAQKISSIARKKNTAGKTASLKLKCANFRIINRQITFNEPTQIGQKIYEALIPILKKEMVKAPFRLIGVGLSELSDGKNADLGDLLNEKSQKSLRLEKAIDHLSNKFGAKTVKRISIKDYENE